MHIVSTLTINDMKYVGSKQLLCMRSRLVNRIDRMIMSRCGRIRTGTLKQSNVEHVMFSIQDIRAKTAVVIPQGDTARPPTRGKFIAPVQLWVA